MAYVAITNAEIATGKPVAATTQTKIQENFADHETRLQAAEVGSSSYAPIILSVRGYYHALPIASRVGVVKTTPNFTLNILGVRILVDQAGTSGSLEIDILRKRGVGVFESIFTTRPLIAAAAGSDALSTAGTLNPTKTDILAGDILRMDITSVQAGTTLTNGGKGFLARIDFNRG